MRASPSRFRWGKGKTVVYNEWKRVLCSDLFNNQQIRVEPISCYSTATLRVCVISVHCTLNYKRTCSCLHNKKVIDAKVNVFTGTMVSGGATCHAKLMNLVTIYSSLGICSLLLITCQPFWCQKYSVSDDPLQFLFFDVSTLFGLHILEFVQFSLLRF